MCVGDSGHRLPGHAPGDRACCTLTEQLVCPAVQGLADSGVLALLIVLDWSEVSQGPHETPEVHLVLSAKQTVV